MRRCIFVSSLFRTFPESRRQVLNLNAEMTSLVALNQSFSPHRVERESNPLCCWRADGECSTEIQQLVRSRFWLAPFSARKTSRPIAFSWCAGAHFRFPLTIQGGVMNRDLPPAVFSSYHFTSFERSDLIGPHQAGRRGRKGWAVREQQREGARSPPLSLFPTPICSPGEMRNSFFLIKR